MREIPLATGAGGTFVNDAVATAKAVYLTDSQRPVLYKVALTRTGAPAPSRRSRSAATTSMSTASST